MKKTKRFIALLTALVLVFSTLISTSAFAAVNKDVVGTDFEVAVGKLKAVKVMEGYPDGSFKPEGEITRAEFAKIAVVSMGLGDAAEASKGTTKFPDVDGTHWASGYINLAVNRSLVSGYPDGTYKPEGKLTNAEAITILTRLVGLGPVVDKDGTWPANYIGRAANEGILKGVNVASTTNATRGVVAKMLVNTLDVEVWGAAGYNNDGTVEYGPLNKTLLTDTLEISVYEEVRVTGYDVDDKELNLKGSSISNGSYDVVADDLDFEEIYLNEVTVWINDDDEVIFAEVTSKQLFDAIEINDDELTLVDADDDYDIDDDAVFYVNGEEEDFEDLDGNEYDYAKVVLNDDGDVIFVNAFDWDDFLVVEKTDDFEIFAYGEELDAEDYTIVKDGKSVSVDDLVKGDILFFNKDAEYAEVFNKSVTGEISRIFDDRIRVEGDDYTRVNANLGLDAKYLDEDGEIANIDSNSLLTDIAEAMEEEGKVTVFVDRFGDMVYLVGELGSLVTTSTYNFVTETSKAFLDRSTDKWTFDVLNVSGKEIAYNLKDADVRGADKEILKNVAGALVDWDATVLFAVGTLSDTIEADLVVEVKIDSDGDVDTVQLLTPNVLGNGVKHKTTAKYFGGMAIASSVPVFLTDDYTTDVDDIVVKTYGELEFDNIIGSGTDTVFYEKDGKIVAIVAKDSDRDEETTDHATVATADSTKVSGKNIWRLKLVIDDAKGDFETKENPVGAADAAVVTKGDFLDVKIDDSTGKVNDVSIVVGARLVAADTLTITSTSDKKFDIGATALRLGSDGVVVDATDSYKVISFNTLKNGDTVKALTVANGSIYVNVLVRTAKVGSTATPVVPTGVATINAGPFALGTDAVVVMDVAAGNTTVYKIEVFDGSATKVTEKFTLVDITYTATDLNDTETAGTSIADEITLGNSTPFVVKVTNMDTNTVVTSKAIVVD
ncbi:MAG: hypothetical protein CVV02_15840 [Firmicutes bacterium HGW-Firmicutes-7]|nr:MAG: hypothetical protein CVV02_15840 [Firmicutes bacterium HGW-Firmicutes-7]